MPTTMNKSFVLTDDILEAIEAARWEKAVGDPAPRPEYFDERYVLPVHREKLLQTKFKHARDDEIVFYEEPHIYSVRGVPADTSVSSLAHDFEDPFDPMMAIRAMKKKVWPRLQYVHQSRQVFQVDEFCLTTTQGCLLHDPKTDTTLASLIAAKDEANHAPGEIVYTVLVDLLTDAQKKKVNSYEWHVFSSAMTDDDICKAWDLNGMFARNHGTEAHLQMELWANSEPCRITDAEVICGLRFVYEQLLPLGATVYRTEWEIFGEEEDVAGSIDLAVLLPDGAMFLVDWKRSLKLSSKIHGYSKMKPPLDHIDSCSGSEYAVQLSSYQYILEKYYGFRIVGRALASLHPDAPYNTFVPYLKEETEYIMGRRRAFVKARTDAEKMPENAHLMCHKTQKLVVDAVVGVEDEKLYTRKAALLHDISFRDAPEWSEKAKAVMHVEETPPLPSKVQWKMRIPKGGFPAMRRDDE